MIIRHFGYNSITKKDRQSLEHLFYLTWGDKNIKEIHPPEMDAMSSCAAENDEIIGYTGVVSWNINIKDTAFKICGLSCVCTHPEHRNRGIGTALVRKATEWIMLCESFDIGLFTCSHKNTPFYENIHPWKRSPDLTLKESDREGAYASNIFHLDVFKLIISAKAGQHTDYFENTTINLNFPKGRFI